MHAQGEHIAAARTRQHKGAENTGVKGEAKMEKKNQAVRSKNVLETHICKHEVGVTIRSVVSRGVLFF